MSATLSPAFTAAVSMILAPTEANRLAFVRAMETVPNGEFYAVFNALREAYPGHDAMFEALLGNLTLLRMKTLQPITPSATIVSPAEGDHDD